MKIRFANSNDADELANVHWICSANQEKGFMYQLGKPFFKTYYNVMLQEKGSIILCAEDDTGKLIGIATGSINAEEHLKALKKNSLRFLLSSVPSLFKNISLIRSIQSRLKPESPEKSGKGYIITSGPRLEYWGWLPDQRSNLGAVELLRKWIAAIKESGVSHVRHEVDVENKKSMEIHKLLGSKIICEFETPDGRKRAIMEYSF